MNSPAPVTPELAVVTLDAPTPAPLLAYGRTDPKAVIAQVRAIQEIMAAVMKEGVHYGVIPGCKNPSLYKPGAEVLLAAFKISVEPEVRIDRFGDHVTYTVKLTGRHIGTGLVVGVGLGSCSTAEDKYGWRNAVCIEEYDNTPEDRRREKWGKGYGNKPPYCAKQVRTNPADLDNTVLKMAKKRAQIDLCLTALAASDCFTQDLEDLPEGYLDGQQGPAPEAAPAAAPNRYQARDRSENAIAPSGKLASEKQVAFVRNMLQKAGKTEADLAKALRLPSFEALTMDLVNSALDWIAGKKAA